MVWLILLMLPGIVVGNWYFAASVPPRLNPDRLIVLEPAFAESKTPVGVPETETTSELMTPVIVGVPVRTTLVVPSKLLGSCEMPPRVSVRLPIVIFLSTGAAASLFPSPA